MFKWSAQTNSLFKLIYKLGRSWQPWWQAYHFFLGYRKYHKDWAFLDLDDAFIFSHNCPLQYVHVWAAVQLKGRPSWEGNCYWNANDNLLTANDYLLSPNDHLLTADDYLLPPNDHLLTAKDYLLPPNDNLLTLRLHWAL